MLEATCCCKAFCIYIANSNSAVDDNFKVLLNGTQIGTIDNSTPTVTGRVFCFPEDVATLTKDVMVLWNAPNPNNLQDTVGIDRTLLINGVNTLRVESIQNNSNGNFGTILLGYAQNGTTSGVQAGRYTVAEEDGLFVTPQTNVSAKHEAQYNFASGVGNGSSYQFNYP